MPTRKKDKGAGDIWKGLKKNPALLIVIVLAIAAVIYILASNQNASTGGTAAGANQGLGSGQGYYLLTEEVNPSINIVKPSYHTKSSHVTAHGGHHKDHGSTSSGHGKKSTHSSGKSSSGTGHGHGTTVHHASAHSGSHISNPNVHSTSHQSGSSTHQTTHIYHQTGHTTNKTSHNPNHLPKAKTTSRSGKVTSKKASNPLINQLKKVPSGKAAHPHTVTVKAGTPVNVLQSKYFPGSSGNRQQGNILTYNQNNKNNAWTTKKVGGQTIIVARGGKISV